MINRPDVRSSPANSRPGCGCSADCCGGAPADQRPATEPAHEADAVRRAVRDHYTAASAGGGCGCGADADAASRAIGYTADDLATLPEGVNLGLGCGTPVDAAGLAPGEAVLDLGSGGGIDALLAARAVGPAGRVIGVDMTPAMIEKSRAAARRLGMANVQFRLGEIEALPVADRSIDVVISNCVVNLSPDKDAVAREAFRVLRPGGRIAISDIVATGDLPAEVRADLALHAACIAGAEPAGRLTAMLTDAGFESVTVEVRPNRSEAGCGCGPAAIPVASAVIRARRPA